MSGPLLITEPTDITAEWIEAAFLAAGHETEVRRVDITTVGTGLMGRSYRVTLDARNAPPSVVVKVPSADVATRQLGAAAYRKEVGFYRDIAPTVTATIPKCHWADISDDGESFVLVLEDISAAKQGDQLEGCTVPEARLALKNLARLHASTWGDASLAERPWCRSSEDAPGLRDYLPIAMTAFEDRFAGVVAETTLPAFHAFVDGADQWLALEPEAAAAVHGDYRLDNLLFGLDESTVTTVDWQTVDYLNPGRDVAYFLGNSLVTEDRRAHEATLIAGYLTELERAGVHGYTSDQAMADMRAGTFQGPLVTMLGAFVASRSARSEQMFGTMADRAAAQILDHDALDLLA